jgi:hypothetical protein
MLRGRRINAWGTLAIGMMLGLAISGGVAAGVWFGQRSPTMSNLPGMADLHLKAMASHGSDTFAIATGPIDDDVEGLFTLDFLTGDLNCYVINPRNAAIGGWFSANVANVLKVEKGKKPSYLIATGNIQVVGTAGGQRPAGCLCYVVDANTGDACAFTFPWVKAATNVGAQQSSPMRPLGPWKTRNRDLGQ